MIYCFNLSNLNFKFKVPFYCNLELALHNKIAVVKTDDIMSNIYIYIIYPIKIDLKTFSDMKFQLSILSFQIIYKVALIYSV